MSELRPVDVCVLVQDLFGCIQKAGISPRPPVELARCVVPAIATKIPCAGKYRIELSARSWGSTHLYGMLLRYQDHAKIIYSQDLNTCWRRFVVCKELAHLLIDTEPQHYTQDPVSLVQELINGVPVMSAEHDLISEQWAMVAAIEMLLPWCLRGQLDAMDREGMTDLQIAHEFRVPEKIVNLMLRSQYKDLSAHSNNFQKIDGAA